MLTGDSLEVLGQMEEGSIDAVVTDPPYGIGFMGHDWDQPGVEARRNGTPQAGFGFHSRNRAEGRGPRFGGPTGRDNTTHTERGGAMEAGRYDLSSTANRAFQGWCEAWAAECLRVLKPGGHLIAAGGSRTHHRLTAGIEDAGFEIRDCLTWLTGSGFPKSLNVSEALRSLPACSCDVVHEGAVSATGLAADGTGGVGAKTDAGASRAGTDVEGGIEQVRRHPTQCKTCGGVRGETLDGFGTALKPVAEFMVVARKPLAGTVAANVLAHGTGALNVDGCRIGDDGGTMASTPDASSATVSAYGNGLNGNRRVVPLGAGRWPANVVLDPAAAEMLDEQTGTLTSGSGDLRRGADKFRTAYGKFKGTDEPADVLYGDSGGASRFFYCAKTSAAERGHGNTHPTVKPVALMRWLVRLVTPPGGTVLDPFCGSGTTGIAALREDLSFVGVEREPTYVAIARQRIREDAPLLNGVAEATA